MGTYCFGIDVGGTTVKCGLFRTDGTLVEKWEIPTRKENNGDQILPDVAAAVNAKIEEKGISKANESITFHCVNRESGRFFTGRRLLAAGTKSPAFPLYNCIIISFISCLHSTLPKNVQDRFGFAACSISCSNPSFSGL